MRGRGGREGEEGGREGGREGRVGGGEGEGGRKGGRGEGGRDDCYTYSNRYVQFNDTVEPLTNDHPHQRPSLSYDHISCDGQWFLFVYESLTSDHPSYTTTPM